MPRESYVMVGGELIRRDQHQPMPVRKGPTILPDLPDFVSPVDGKRYSGRAGMREHNLRNNVVPVEDLKGLPYLTATSDMRSKEQIRQDQELRKQSIIQQVNRHYK